MLCALSPLLGVFPLLALSNLAVIIAVLSKCSVYLKHLRYHTPTQVIPDLSPLSSWIMERTACRNLGLSSLLGKVPHLLDACVSHNSVALPSLRLVNREASNVALLALRSYTVRFEGETTDTNLGGASLLQRTHLQHLNVRLCLSGRLIWYSGSGLYNHQRGTLLV